jgi:Primase X
MMATNNECLQTQVISENVDFILSHFQQPLFPRKIMTKRLGYQIEVHSKQELLDRFEQSNYEDCRINVYPPFTNYHGINRVAPSFLMIDLDLRDFTNIKHKLDRGLKRILHRIDTLMHGHPSVLWTGNGYHIYQPMDGFVLEEEEIFARFADPAGKDLTSRFMQFAEDFLTNKRGDPQHNPTVNSCLVRIPGTINSKCGQEVKIVQQWDGQRPAIQYLLREFRRWLIDEKIEERRMLNSRMAHTHTQAINSSSTIWWIEKLLQTPIDDQRKYAVWHILIPYLINIRKLASDEANDITRSWLEKCNSLRRLDFNPNYKIKYNINNAKKGGYLPISLEKLKTKNMYLYKMINEQ